LSQVGTQRREKRERSVCVIRASATRGCPRGGPRKDRTAKNVKWGKNGTVGGQRGKGEDHMTSKDTVQEARRPPPCPPAAGGNAREARWNSEDNAIRKKRVARNTGSRHTDNTRAKLRKTLTGTSGGSRRRKSTQTGTEAQPVDNRYYDAGKGRDEKQGRKKIKAKMTTRGGIGLP